MIAALSLLACAVSAGAQTVQWGPPLEVEGAPPFAQPPQIDAIACPSTRLCVGVEPGGIVTSTAPVGTTPNWTPTALSATPRYPRAALGSVSCPSVRLCVVGDEVGDVLVSTNPTGGPTAWRTVRVGSGLSALSCPSRTLCVGVATGEILASTNPAGARPVWRAARLSPSDLALASVDCPTVHLCVAEGEIDAGGAEILVSTRPAGGAGRWRPLYLGLRANLLYSDVACPSVRLCVITDRAGDVLSSRRPAATHPAWAIARHTGAGRTVACPSTRLCVSVSARSVASSNAPAGGRGRWRSSPLAQPLVGAVAMACARAGPCAAADSADEITTATSPGRGGAAWTRVSLNQGFTGLDAVSCPDAALCLAPDAQGNAAVSTDPIASPATWAVAPVTGLGPRQAPASATCPSDAFCAVAAAGEVFVSTGPGQGAPWIPAQLSTTAVVRSISCPSASLCVAGLSNGRIAISSNPVGGASTWSESQLGAASICGATGCVDDPIVAVSCPEAQFCAATDGASLWVSTAPAPGNPWARSALPAAVTAISCPAAGVCALAGGDTVLETADAADPAPQWSQMTLPAEQAVQAPIGATPMTALAPSVTGLSCASVDLCVAVDGQAGYAFTGAPSAPSTPWTGVQIDPPTVGPVPGPMSLTGVSCAVAFCAAVDGSGHVLVGVVVG